MKLLDDLITDEQFPVKNCTHHSSAKHVYNGRSTRLSDQFVLLVLKISKSC